MNDTYLSWKISQDQRDASSRATVSAATRLLPRSERFQGDLAAARAAADARARSWDTCMGVWGLRK